MTFTFYLILAFLLILLNAFFVLAEFAAVKMRPTQVEALAEAGNRRAKVSSGSRRIWTNIFPSARSASPWRASDWALSASPPLPTVLFPLVRRVGLSGLAAGVTAHGISVALAYLLVSFLHIVLGELVPKSVAIRSTEKAALADGATPWLSSAMSSSLPIWLLNTTVNAILRLFRLPPVNKDQAAHSEEEIRIILDQSQSSGMLSFRQAASHRKRSRHGKLSPSKRNAGREARPLPQPRAHP